MKYDRHRHYLAGVALIVTLLATAGCKFMSSFNRHSDTPSSSSIRTEITRMPGVTVTDMDATGRHLTAAGLTVVVKRPKLVVPTREKSGLNSVTLPEIVRPFQPSQWNHMIAAQEPAPGTPVQPGSVITLTAGIHHGASPFRPWLDAHGGAVNSIGEQRCRDCHPQRYCTECHDKVYNRTDIK